MHELSICEALLRQVLMVAASRGLRRVEKITLRIGPLAGIEPELVRFAFPLVAAGTACAGATILIESVPVRVRCQLCRSESDARPNCLLCGTCGAWRVTILSGDEMLLASVEVREPADV